MTDTKSELLNSVDSTDANQPRPEMTRDLSVDIATSEMQIAFHLLVILGGAHAFLLPAPQQPSLARRAALKQAAQNCAVAAAALVSVPHLANAALADLDDGGAPEQQAKDGSQMLVMTDGASGTKRTKPEEITPVMRIKELKAKQNKTDKEKRELKLLIADEMCEMLGRGC